MRLAEFDTAPAGDAAAVVRVWADVPSWVDAIVAGRPYESVDELAAEAALLAADWDETDLDTALQHHPRIGERAGGASPEASASRGEQAAMATAADATAAAIAARNAHYEERFGRVFLVRAAGRSAEQILAELARRLDNDPETETDEALEQLTEIAVLRLRSTFQESS